MPTDAEVEAALLRLVRAEERAYFFDRLTNPDWVAPLDRLGAFKNLPAPQPAPEPGYVTFPNWPEGRYLARVAAEASASVSAAIKNANPRGNPNNAAILFAAARALSDSDLPELMASAGRWLGEPFPDNYGDEAAALIIRVFDAGLTAQGVRLAMLLLSVRKSQDRFPLSDWYYRRCTRTLVGPGTAAAGVAFLKLLTDLLTGAIRSELDEFSEVDRLIEFSYVWRPAIGEHEQNSDRGLRAALVSSIRDSALELLRESPENAESVRDVLSGDALRRRIWMHVVSAWSDGGSWADAALDHETLSDFRLSHEVSELLRAHFASLTTETKARILDWVNTPSEGDDDVPEEARKATRRDRFSYIAEHLGADDQAAYQALIADVGPPSRSTGFLMFTESSVGSRSPVEDDEAATMSPSALADFVKNWVPPADHFWPPGPSAEGLAATLRIAVEGRPQEFASAAKHFIGADATFARALLNGVENAVAAHEVVDWQPVMDLCAWIVDQAIEAEDDATSSRDRDPGFRWARAQVADLLRLGFDNEAESIPFTVREQAWRLVAALAADPNPTPEHEQRYGGENMRPFELSLNTNRGKAFHAAIRYGLWCYRHLGGESASNFTGVTAMPELFSLLEAHLRPEIEPSLAVRAVYARWYPWLQLLDHEWAVANVSSVFGQPGEPDELAKAGWEALLIWTAPYDSTFRALEPWYIAAVEMLATDDLSNESSRHSPREHLMEHLMTFGWRGVAESTLVDRALANASDPVAAHAMTFIGRTLRNTVELSENIRARLVALWERRLAVIQDDPVRHADELQAFGAWVESGKFDVPWVLAMLEHSVRLGGPPDGRGVIDALARDEVEPAKALELLLLMTATSTRVWDSVAWREPARRVIERAIETHGITDNAVRAADFFIRKGDQSIRDLFERSNEE